ncbi:DUF421 domain-containing protein [Williamsia serinedens]|nr:YetF domain-containing protein [Williamsia serinedens]
MTSFTDQLVGDAGRLVLTAVKTVAMFATAAIALRLSERRTIAEFAPYDWAAAVAIGAIVGRTATAADTSCLVGSVALVALLAAHSALTRARFLPGVARLVDPPIRVLVEHGHVNRRAARRAGLTDADLDGILRRHGHFSAATVRWAIVEPKGAVTVIDDDQ